MDIRNNDVVPGDTVVTALREGNVAALRVGVVDSVIWQTKPNVTQTDAVVEAEPEPVLLVNWNYSSTKYLPIKATKVPAAHVVRLDRV